VLSIPERGTPEWFGDCQIRDLEFTCLKCGRQLDPWEARNTWCWSCIEADDMRAYAEAERLELQEMEDRMRWEMEWEEEQVYRNSMYRIGEGQDDTLP